MDDGITIHTPKPPRDKRPSRAGARKKTVTQKNRPIDPNDPRERKYQGIRGYLSDRWLTDSKMSLRVLTMASTDEYMNAKDQKDILKTKSNLDKLYELAKTRDVKKQEAILRFGHKQSKLTANRDETIAKFVTGYRGTLPHNFVRYGNLVAKHKRRAETRPNSSKGKVKTTSVRGFDSFNKDYTILTRSLLRLVRSGSGNTRRVAKKLAKQFKITVK